MPTITAKDCIEVDLLQVRSQQIGDRPPLRDRLTSPVQVRSVGEVAP